MFELLELIKSGYLKRTADIEEQKNIWIKLSGQFKPDLALYRAGRPSLILARETGDLGLSVLWIVQAALIRPILKEISLKSDNDNNLRDILSRINYNSLCALAHSENPAEPVVISDTGNGYSLSGEKKFITAGKNAELMIVTCRTEGEDKISRIAIIEPSLLTADSLPDLKLEIMKSVSHTKLILDNTVISYSMVPGIAPQMVRKLVKKFGLIERALILEAFLSFLLYAEKTLNTAGAGIHLYEEISALLEKQTDFATNQINEAVYGEKIETPNIPLQSIMPHIGTFKNAYIKHESSLPEAENIKLKDLFLFDNLKG